MRGAQIILVARIPGDETDYVMGELVVGRPALQVKTAVSIPLDLVSVMSLLYRAVPGSGLDRWLIGARRALPEQLQQDLDVLHGFSGRLLYYMEEPIMRFEPLREDRAGSSIDDLLWFLGELQPEEFRQMAIRALDRVHQDLGTGLAAPAPEEEGAWYRYVEPGLTTADAAEVVALVRDPEALQGRTMRLIRGIWDSVWRRIRASPAGAGRSRTYRPGRGQPRIRDGVCRADR